MSSLCNLLKQVQKTSSVLKIPIRNLNLLEYQSKHLLRENGVAVQDFCMIDASGDKELEKFNVKEYVIKAQILAGGRGKGHFSNGYKGGVKITEKRDEIKGIVNNMLGHKLITKQTPKDGILVKKIMVAESVNIMRETYVCIVLDRSQNGPVIIASPAGGMDIEGVAEKTPHLIKNLPIDIFEGITDSMANDIATFLEFKGDTKPKAAHEIKKLWELFKKVDATQIEINPLVETDDGKVVSVDAKLNFDDNAKFRQKDIFAMDDESESDPREVEAAKYNLNYIGMGGNIGCLVNGAGLAMATMDIIKLYGGDPANFLDVGGSVKEDQVKKAFELLTKDKKVQSILVNVFGGIVNCATIANGIVSACKSMKLEIPLVVRLEGTNVDEAKRIIKESGLPILAAEHLDDAAQKAVKSVQ
ncbi:PREDICTED: succinyl-CoA ligase [GDP-forming] subunit beta, mitochondrial [Nicrophorus vespilloides]|uniref:Succinate--CoA ligase [GDP-forming] subunit beta, mitochondrial n=1 Tax=Nicrophorus vespilloides TaxID=110193 RepID=A0ABM1M5C5_NICVS|nr:PREDICTED: succinyl-CoA ligase [GDP-forming] subunit beta, mitochondrial [Nicrophorus vespilloides]